MALDNWQAYAEMSIAALVASAGLLSVRAVLMTVRRWIYGRSI